MDNKIKAILPVIVTFLVTFVAFNVSAGDVYAGFTHETTNNRVVCFNSSATFTSEKIESYHWEFGDGSESNRSHPCHEYNIWEIQRDFVVSLTVTDERGVQNTFIDRITVSNIGFYVAVSIVLFGVLFFVMSDWKEIKKKVGG